MRHDDLTMEEAARLFVAEQMTQQAISKKYHCRPSTVRQLLREAAKAGIEVRRKGGSKYPGLKPEEIASMHRQGMTPQEIAAETGYCLKTIGNKLRAAGIYLGTAEKPGPGRRCTHRQTDADCDTCPYPDCIATRAQIEAWAEARG